MPLPSGENAILELEKLEGYCLSPAHPRGRHKARVFREALGIARIDSAWLKDELLRLVQNCDAWLERSDEFGDQWRVDILVKRQDKEAVVRTIWIVRTGETVPRFVTGWIR